MLPRQDYPLSSPSHLLLLPIIFNIRVALLVGVGLFLFGLLLRLLVLVVLVLALLGFGRLPPTLGLASLLLSSGFGVLVSPGGGWEGGGVLVHGGRGGWKWAVFKTGHRSTGVWA